MDLQNGSGKDALWVPGSWRARAASLLAWLSLAMATAPIGFSAFQQGLSIAGPYIAIAVVGLVLMSTNRIPPRIVALLLTSFWFMVAAFGVLTLGLGSPIMVTALAIFATLCSLFYGRLGLVLAISGVALVNRAPR